MTFFFPSDRTPVRRRGALLLTAFAAFVSMAADPPAGEPSSPAVTLAAEVDAHPEVDRIYATFRTAYRDLDSALVGGLYTEDALYLQPSSDLKRGRDSIQKGFADFFGMVREGNGSLDITFEIVDRQRMADGVVDVGIFEIARDGRSRTMRGKFVAVAVPDGRDWKIRVDSFSPLPPEAE